MMAWPVRRFVSTVICVTFCLVAQRKTVEGKGAGRAFPIAAENDIIARFKTINPSVEWDATNFLVDLSGQYATCAALSKPSGVFNVERETPNGETITGVIDYTPGQETHIVKVTEYIGTIVDRWQNRRTHDNLIRSAKEIGCSVRPGCQGNVVVACLFSPGRPGVVILTGPTPRPGRLPRPTDRPQEQRQQTIGTINRVEKSAVAFTREQYREAEESLGRKWDRSYYLENLSGFETDCSMIGLSRDQWPFRQLKQAHQQPEIPVVGQFGYARNLGSTPEAMKAIIANMTQVFGSPELVGCSLIADCIRRTDRQMYVVVTCLFADNNSRWAFEATVKSTTRRSAVVSTTTEPFEIPEPE